MTTVALAVIVTLVAVLGLCLGTILGRPVRGSCGGLTCLRLNCAGCGKAKKPGAVQ